jgi:hypothetical protein
MPQEPSQIPVEVLLHSIETSSTQLADRSTELSDLIGRIAERLCNMPGKATVRVESDVGELIFSKGRGGWGLWLLDDNCPSDLDGPVADDLTQVSIKRKARAFPLLLELMREIENEHKRQISAIEEAAALVFDGPGSVGSNRKEGN